MPSAAILLCTRMEEGKQYRYGKHVKQLQAQDGFYECHQRLYYFVPEWKKVNSTDTANMLSSYKLKTDSTNAISGYTTLYQNGKKVNSIDTANMLSSYKLKTDSTDAISGYTTLYQNGKKVNSTDTANMLSSYKLKTDSTKDRKSVV